jgi:hypothetical protein
MYFVSKLSDGIHIRNGDGKTIASGSYDDAEELLTLVKGTNVQPDVQAFCEQVVFWHKNFGHEPGSEIQHITSKIVLQLAEDVLRKL